MIEIAGFHITKYAMTWLLVYGSSKINPKKLQERQFNF